MAARKLQCSHCKATNRVPAVAENYFFVCQWCGEKTEISPFNEPEKTPGPDDLPELMRAHAAFVGKPCSHCRSPFELGDRLHNCPECAQTSHASCWDQHEGCGDSKCPEVGLKAFLPETHLGTPLEMHSKTMPYPPKMNGVESAKRPASAAFDDPSLSQESHPVVGTPPLRPTQQEKKKIPSSVVIWGTGFAIANLLAAVFAGYYCLTSPMKISGKLLFVFFIFLALGNARAGKGIAEGEAESVWLAVFLGCICLTPSILLFTINPGALFLYLGLVFCVFIPPLYLAIQAIDRFEYRWGKMQPAISKAPKQTSSMGCLEYFLISGLVIIVAIFGATNMMPYQGGFFRQIQYTPTVKPSELYDAVSRGDLAAVDRLLGSGSNVLAVNSSGETPLHLAVEKGNTRIAALLLARGASLQARDKVGRTPFHNVTTREITAFLLQKGALLQQGDLSAASPLHHAVYFHRLEAVQALLDAGANVNSLDKYGEGPLHKTIYGTPAQDLPIAQLLIKMGAEVKLRSSAGDTPYLLALKRGNQEMADFFKKSGAE